MRAKYAVGAVLCSGECVCTQSIQVPTHFLPLILSYGHTQPMKMKVVPVLLTGMKTKVINHKYRENKLWRQIVADNEVQIVYPHLCVLCREHDIVSTPWSLLQCRLWLQIALPAQEPVAVNIGMTSFSGQPVSYHCSVYFDKKSIELFPWGNWRFVILVFCLAR